MSLSPRPSRSAQHAVVAEFGKFTGTDSREVGREILDVGVTEQFEFSLAAVKLAVGEAAVAARNGGVEVAGVTGEFNELPSACCSQRWKKSGS